MGPSPSPSKEDEVIWCLDPFPFSIGRLSKPEIILSIYLSILSIDDFLFLL